MAKWHLCNPLGTSERTCEAESEFWAKRKFAPLPKGWFVASDCSYRIGWRGCDIPTPCAKCFRNLPHGKSAYCEPCQLAKRREAHAALMRRGRGGRKGKNTQSPTRSASIRAFYDAETPQQKAERKAKMSRIALDTRSRSARQRAINSTILNGIARRAAKRQALQLSLSL
tara:strand:+ start:1592 stop:2101 length:510 start_codon:yes stop_codon:yes gene_type:complete